MGIWHKGFDFRSCREFNIVSKNTKLRFPGYPMRGDGAHWLLVKKRGLTGLIATSSAHLVKPFFNHFWDIWHGSLEFSTCRGYNLVFKMVNNVFLGALRAEICSFFWSSWYFHFHYQSKIQRSNQSNCYVLEILVFSHQKSIWHISLEFIGYKEFSLVSKMLNYVFLYALWDDIELINN